MTEEHTLNERERQTIALEEDIVQTVTQSLSSQRDRKLRRVGIESARARELTAKLVAASSDVDKQLLASDEAVAHALSKQGLEDLGALEKQLMSPYFARFVTEEEENGRTVQREYRLGTAGNPDCRIVDWRKAPISKLYYEYQEGEEFSEEIQGRERNGSISLRNSVQIKKGELLRLQSKEGSFIKRNGAWQNSQGGSVRMSTGVSYGQLPSILSLITADQFRTITEDAQSAILIQGIAGSGKTTVALHRLAWLLHEDNSPLEKEDSLILVLAPALKAYIAHSLQGLDLDGVPLAIFKEWSSSIFKHVLPELIDERGELITAESPCPRSIMRVKRSLALLRFVEEQEALYKDSLAETLIARFPAQETAIRKAFQLHPLIPALRDLRDHTFRGNKDDLEYLTSLLEEERQLPKRLLALLRNRKGLLACDASGLINDALLNDVLDRTETNAAAGVIDVCDSSILLRLVQIRYGMLPRPDGHFEQYQHIVVDEVQDYGPVELAVVINAVQHTYQLTLVGDVAQMLTDDVAFPGWERLKQYWHFPEESSRYVSLTISYRSTLPIMRLADHVQQRQSVDNGRKGKRPVWFHSRLEERALQAAMKWLDTAYERFPDALTAVLCSSQKEARHVVSLLTPRFGHAVRLGSPESFSFEEGILVTDIKTTKGLEFFNVLLWNPSRNNYPENPVMRNKLYVGITRAEEHLAILTWGRPSPLLPHRQSRLVRYVGLDIDDQEVEKTTLHR